MSTIVGNVLKADGEPFVGQVQFRQLNPKVKLKTPSIITHQDIIAVTDAEGDFEQELVGGKYFVTYGQSAPFKICVPNDELTHNIKDLLLVLLERAACCDLEEAEEEGDDLPGATSTTPGVVKTTCDDGDPVVICEEDADARYVPKVPALDDSEYLWIKVLPDGSYDATNGKLKPHFYNADTGKYHTISVAGPAEALQLVISEGIDYPL